MKKKSRPGAVPRIQQTGRRDSPPPADDELFGRVASILEQARTNVVRAVNHNMVVAYWLIGREIVMELQRGQERAGYGEEMLKLLSWRLTQQFGAGYSPTNLRNFRFFYLAYSELDVQIQHTACAKFGKNPDGPTQDADILPDFSPQLSWSHYRLLMRWLHRIRELGRQDAGVHGPRRDRLGQALQL